MIILKKIDKKNDSFFNKFKYLTHFVFKAFLMSIMCFLFIIVLLIGLYMGDLFFNINNERANPLFGAYVIVSPSMVPTIKVNDAIIIKRVDNDKYKIGDIITFSSSDANYEGLMITHRIVDKQRVDDNSSSYITKGDNNKLVDSSSVLTDDIYGKVLFKIPKIGYLQDFFLKPSNYFLCLILVAIVFIFYEISRILLVILRNKIIN